MEDEWVEVEEKSSKKEKRKDKERDRDRDRNRDRDRASKKNKSSNENENEKSSSTIELQKSEIQRDEWMSVPFSSSKNNNETSNIAGSDESWLSQLGKNREERQSERDKKRERDEQLSKMLSSASGLVKSLDTLVQDNSSNSTTTTTTTATITATTDSKPSYLVGDGGASWRAKKLLRTKQQADEMGMNLDQALKERFDESEVKRIEESRSYNSNNNYRSHRDSSYNGSGNRARESTRDYLKKDDDIYSQMKKPSDSSKYLWSQNDKNQSTINSREELDRGRYSRDRDSRYSRDSRDNRDSRDSRDSRESRDSKESRGNRDSRDSRESRDSRDSRDNRDSRDSRESGDSRDSRDNRDKGSREFNRNLQEKESEQISRDGDVRELNKIIESRGDKEVYRNKDEKEFENNREGNKEIREVKDNEVTQQKNLNKLSAELMKAKIMGDKSKQNKLEKQIEELKKQVSSTTTSSTNEKVKLSGLDQYGRKIFLNEKSLSHHEQEYQQQKEEPKYDERIKKAFDAKKGERDKYYQDDNDYDLKTLVSMEKKQSRDESSRDMDYEFLKTISKSEKWAKDDREDFGPDYDNIKNISAKKKQESDEKEIRKFKDRVLFADKKVNSILEKCWYCQNSNQFQKHMVIATGTRAYLSLPTRGSLTPGHCTIIPIAHTLSCVETDEDTFDEITNFKKCLIQMFAKEDKYCVFLETAMKFKQQHHTLIDCIPLSYDIFSTAPGYFKKSLMEAESEWAPHKLIDTIKKGGLKNSIPKNFPYLWVEFGYKQIGYLHPIDKEIEFQRDFGKSIIMGLLELDLDEVYNKRRSRNDEEFLVKNFKSKFQPFDWTTQLYE